MSPVIWSETLARIVTTARGFFRRHWMGLLRLRDRMQLSEDGFHLLIAGLVGVVGGGVNLLFFGAVRLVTGLGLGTAGDLVTAARALDPWQRAVIPAVGGMVAGLVLYWGLRLAGTEGASHIVEAVAAGSGRLRMRESLIKAVSSILSIGTGASIGREGAITHLTATLASKGGQLAGWQPYRLRLLVACGAASGMAAAYNAPVAGAVFAAQIVLGNFSMNLFGPLVFASVISTMISRSIFGLGPWYEAPAFTVSSLYQLPIFVVLGGLSGVVGGFFLRGLRLVEGRFEALKWPIYDRLAVGGLFVGLVGIGFPEVWGNGYAITNDILHGRIVGWAVLGILVAKLLATVVCVGSGTIGGVFTPTLFLGAALGSVSGSVLHAAGWAVDLPLAAFALVGMGGVLAATIHSPLLALIILLEISANYSLLPALMLACVSAALVGRRVHADSVYLEPVRRKGAEVERESGRVGAATLTTVGEVMRDPVPPLRETATFRQIAERFLTSPYNFLPVVDAERHLLGVVALHDLKEHLTTGHEYHSVIAYDLMRPPPPCLTPDQRLLDALPVLLASELRNVPVVNNRKEFKLVGVVVRSDALGLFSEAISASGARM